MQASIQPPHPRFLLLVCQLSRNLLSRAEVYLVWRLASKGGVRHLGVVGRDVEGDLPVESGHGVKRIQE